MNPSSSVDSDLLSLIFSLPEDQSTRACELLNKAYGRSLKQHKAKLSRQYYLHNPVKWAEEKIGSILWSGQKSMLNAIRDHKRNAFYSCHRIGKDYAMALVACWWIDCHEPGEAMVITTAHSSSQIKTALWREIGRVHDKGMLSGRLNLQEWYIERESGKEEIVAFGRKPADTDHTGLHGTYNTYNLFMIDEACYVADSIFDGGDTLVSNDKSKIVAWANPDDSSTRFGKICQPGSGWNVIRYGYEDTPNFTNEPGVPQSVKDNLISQSWVDQKRLDWGEDSPMYQSKVMGVFPDNPQDSLIKMSWIRAAQERSLPRSLPSRLGLDVGGGRDKSVFCLTQGPVSRIIYSDQDPNTTATQERGFRFLAQTNSSSLCLDMLGIGWDIAMGTQSIASDDWEKENRPDRARLAKKFIGVKVSQSAKDNKAFANLRSELYWKLRKDFELGLIDIDAHDEKLAGQLSAIKYHERNGRIQVQSKSEMSKSPDEMDALVLSRIDPENDLPEDKNAKEEIKRPWVR